MINWAIRSVNFFDSRLCRDLKLQCSIVNVWLVDKKKKKSNNVAKGFFFFFFFFYLLLPLICILSFIFFLLLYFILFCVCVAQNTNKINIKKKPARLGELFVPFFSILNTIQREYDKLKSLRT
jgi:hypothetical protein